MDRLYRNRWLKMKKTCYDVIKKGALWQVLSPLQTIAKKPGNRGTGVASGIIVLQ